MRLFTAISRPATTREHLAQVLPELRSIPMLRDLVSWTKLDNFHITLKFIGDVPDDRVPLLITSLRTLTIPSMTLAVDRFLVLPGQGPARVLAANVTRDIAPITVLFNQIESASQP